MGIMKSVTSAAMRRITSSMGNLFEGSPRLQSLTSIGADLLAPEGPGRSGVTNALLGALKDKGLAVARDQLFGDAKPGLVQSLLDSDQKSGLLKKAVLVAMPALATAIALLSKLTDVLKSASASLDQKAGATPPAGTPLAGLIKAGTPILAPAPDAAFDDWFSRNKVSRSEFGDTDRQLRDKQNLVALLQTDLRMAPGSASVTSRLEDAMQNATRAQELHADSMDKRYAILEEGKQFGDRAIAANADDPVPEDWNRPVDFIPANWDQGEGPSR